jgi:hypothetical protein
MVPLSEVPAELQTLDVRIEDNFEFLFKATPKDCQTDLMNKVRLDEESREARIRDSMEYELVAIIKKMLMGETDEYSKPNPLIIEGEKKEQYLKNADIANTFNADRPEGKQMDTRRIGRTLHKLRFNAKIIKSAGKSTRAVEIKKEHIDSLLSEYFLGKQAPPPPKSIEKPAPTTEKAVTLGYMNGVPEGKEDTLLDKKKECAPLMCLDVTEQGVPPLGSIPDFQPKPTEAKPNGDRAV